MLLNCLHLVESGTRRAGMTSYAMRQACKLQGHEISWKCPLLEMPCPCGAPDDTRIRQTRATQSFEKFTETRS